MDAPKEDTFSVQEPKKKQMTSEFFKIFDQNSGKVDSFSYCMNMIWFYLFNILFYFSLNTVFDYRRGDQWRLFFGDIARPKLLLWENQKQHAFVMSQISRKV